jgi:hypothetical protein
MIVANNVFFCLVYGLGLSHMKIEFVQDAGVENLEYYRLHRYLNT